MEGGGERTPRSVALAAALALALGFAFVLPGLGPMRVPIVSRRRYSVLGIRGRCRHER